MLNLGYRRLVRPLLFRAGSGDPELTHEATLRYVARLGEWRAARNLVSAFCVGRQTPVTVAGVSFPSVVGLAAGMDKDGVALHGWPALGFGHVELGTVTTRRQAGNPRPRVFRLTESAALINRMGFPNAGAAALADRLAAAGVVRGNNVLGIPLGISIGLSRTTSLTDATDDYLAALRLVATRADYIAVNVSSPNTPGLRSLADAEALKDLLETLVTETRTIDPDAPAPIFVKVAPDLGEEALEQLLEVAADAGARGLIAVNTTVERDGIAAADQWKATQSGGLSGAPLTLRARAVVQFLAERTTLPIIGVGGILTRDDGAAMLDAGAQLLQVYTGYVYSGPALVKQLSRLNTPE